MSAVDNLAGTPKDEDTSEMTMKEGLDGRAVLVFGAAGALGAGLTAAFAASGALVTGADRFMPADGTATEGVTYQTVDVLDDDALRPAVEHGRRIRTPPATEIGRASCRERV